MENIKNVLEKYRIENAEFKNKSYWYSGYSGYSGYSVYLFISYPIRYIWNIFRNNIGIIINERR